MHASVRRDIKKKKGVGDKKKFLQQWLYGLPRMNG
jgi:hypothetical protein